MQRSLSALLSKAPSLTAVAALLTLTACGTTGGQTGTETNDPCNSEHTPLAVDEVSPLGFAPQALLELAHGTRGAELRWLDAPDAPYGPESGIGSIELQLEAKGGAEFARVNPERLDLLCRDHVRLPVRVALATAGGAFDERFETHLTATRSDEAGLNFILQPSSLSGSFAFEPGVLEGRRLERIQFDVRFEAEQASGSIQAGIEQTSGSSGADGSVSLRVVPLACFGEATLEGLCAQSD
jgi:hypothetical protein